MAKATAAKAKAAKIPTVVTSTSPEMSEGAQVFKVSEGASEEEIARMDGMPGMRLQFDYVYFRKLSDEFVATLSAASQKAYWLAQAEYDSRVRQANIAQHSIGVDPLSKILDRPRGKNNPLVRDGEKVSLAINKGLAKRERWYVTWRIQGGEGSLGDALEAGFRLIRRPKDKVEEETKSPLEWSGEVWKIPDGTADPTSGEAIYNVMVTIRQKLWDDSNKAMSMASHNAYAQVKAQFVEGAENISRDMLGGKERVLAPEWDMDEIHEEELHNARK